VQADGTSFIVRHWRGVVFATLMAGAGLIGAVVTSPRFEQPLPTETAEISSTAPTDAAPVEIIPDAAAPAPEATERAPTQPGDVPAGHVFAPMFGQSHIGYLATNRGDCSSVLGGSPQELAAEVEAQLGLRIAGSDWFKDGIIVNFRDGSRRIVWGKEIDCKDPPYNPLGAASQ